MVKVFQIGCGKMSKYTMAYAIEKGYEVVGAVDVNEAVIGHDIGEIIETENKGVIINNVSELKNLLTELKPDIAIVTTMSLIKDLGDVLKICCECGVNAITTCEEAFYPSVSNPNLYKEIDELAKENGCTVTGSGYQDVFWGNLIYTLAGSIHKITKIKGSSSYNVEDYGIALAEAHGAGYTMEEFENKIASLDKISDEERNKIIESGEYLPSYMWNVVPWLADRFGLHLKNMKQECVPINTESELESSTLGITIPVGNARGMSAIVTGETEEGIVIEAECIGKVYTADEVDTNAWTIEGEPTTSIIVTEPDTVRLTCASIVNRIPDVINNVPGYVETSKMGELEFKL